MNKNKLTTSLVASFFLATTNLYSQDLPQITVSSATKSEQSIKDVTSNVEVITKEEIEERHFTTVQEAINSLAGIDIVSNGGLGKSSSVKVRGFDSKRVLVLIDGVRYNDHTSTSGAPFENIMVHDIKRIELIKGAQSGIWGADASAGVINIITNDAKKDLHGGINLEYGSFNTKKYGVNLSYANEDYYVKASYNKITTDGFTAYATKGTDIDSYEDDAYENETIGLKTGFNLDDENKIDFGYSVSKSENEFDNSGSDSLTNESSSKNKFYTINYENINSVAKTNVYFNRSDFYRDYPSFGSTYDGKIDEIGVKTKFDYLSDSSFIVAGIDAKEFEEDDSISKDYTNKGAFFTNSNRFDNTVITESIRFDDYNTFDDKITGKIGIKHNFTKDLFISSNYGTAYNIPTLNQLYGAFGANSNLNPETTKSYDLSLGYHGLVATYFNSKIEDMIDWVGAGYINVNGESELKGFELSYKKEIVSNTLLSLAYTRLSAKDDVGQYLARRANQTLKFGMDYYGFDSFHINLNGEYIGERYNNANKQGAQTGKYTVWNSVVNYELNKDTKIYLKLDNITNKYYQTVDGYATAPRSAYLGVNYKF